MNRTPRYHNHRSAGRRIANRADDLVALIRLGVSAADDAGNATAVNVLLRLLPEAKRRALALDAEESWPGARL
jgi:hypothetical protein